MAQSTDAVQQQIKSKGGLLSSMTSKLQSSENQVKALTQETQSLQSDLKSAQALIENLKIEVSEHQGKVAELVVQNTTNTEKIITTQAALDASLAKLALLQEKEMQLNALQAQTAASKKILDDLNARVQEQDGIIIDLRDKLDATTQDLGSAGGTIGSMKEDLGARGSTISELKADLDQAIYKTREREGEINRLRTDVAKAKSNVRQYRKSVEDLELHRMVLGGGLVLLFLGLIFALRRRR